MYADLQSTKPKDHGHRNFRIAVELDVPEQRHWKKCTKPISGYVDCCCGVINVCERLRGVATSTLDGSVPCVRYRPALEDDVQHGNQVHRCEHCRHRVQTVRVLDPVRSDTHQHEGDAELDGNDGRAVEDLEKEEILFLLAKTRNRTQPVVPACPSLSALYRVWPDECQCHGMHRQCMQQSAL